VLPRTNFSVQSNNITLNTIPRRFYIAVRRRNADRTYLTTDTFGAITAISVNWDNNSGLLSSATQRDLYNMSRKNGLKMTWPQFCGTAGNGANALNNNQISTVGSIICIEMGSDIGLPDDQAPGQLGRYQLQLRVDGTNPSFTDTINYTMYIFVCSEGIFSIQDNTATTTIGVIDTQAIVNSSNWPSKSKYENQSMYGGNFWSGLKNFASNVQSGVEKALPYIQTGLEVAKLAGIGHGSNCPVSDAEIDKMIEENKPEGSGMSGGRMLDRRLLAKRLRPT
jgi:hypothetical protein